MNLPYDLAVYIDSVTALTLATDLLVEYIPALPDTLVSVTSTGGLPTGAKLGYDKPTIQIYSRSDNPQTAYNNIAAVYNALQGLHQVTLNSNIFLVDCQALQSAPIRLGVDEKQRFEYTQNYILDIRNLTTHRQ